jgi:hypothetical protein
MKQLMKLRKLLHPNLWIAVLPIIMLACAQVSAQEDPDNPVPGTLPPDDSGPSLIAASAPLAPVYTESGAITLSVDGMGTLTSTGNIRVQKPAGATVRRAFLGSVTTGGSRYQLGSNDIALAGTTVVFTLAASNAISSFNYWGEVTSIVMAKHYRFSQHELPPAVAHQRRGVLSDSGAMTATHD